METKFTKGPWVLEQWSDSNLAYTKNSELLGPNLVTNGNYDICYLSFNTSNGADESIHDAHLIAAAPELYHALNQAVTSMQDSGYRNEHVAVKCARLALAKARGES